MDGKPGEIFGKGYMTTEKLMVSGVPFNRINEWLSSGAIEKADRGVYCLPETKRDDLALIQYKYDRCVFSGITALSVLGLSDHISDSIHVTFPQGYNPSSLNDCQWNLSVTRSVPKIYETGITTAVTAYGNEIRVYDMERSLCDILRGKGMSPFIVKTAMRRYLSSPDRDVDLLRNYADLLHVSDRIEPFIELF